MFTKEYTISKFSGAYRFLSNFYPSNFRDYVGDEWPTVEHFFQAMKIDSEKEREKIRNLPSPGQAKKIGRLLELRNDWESVKFNVMRDALYYKFRQNKDLKEKLKETGKSHIVEGNTWHDNIWGDCYCDKCKNIKGQNYLGRLLMGVRNRL